MRRPEDVQAILARRYRSQAHLWLDGAGQWPLVVNLAAPDEAAARRQPEVLAAFVQAWRNWQGMGTVVWRESQWRILGRQTLPMRLELGSQVEIAAWLGVVDRHKQEQVYYDLLVGRWSQLKPVAGKLAGELAVEPDSDARRLVAVLDWLMAHPASGLYPRQMPVAGVDTKWLERHKGWLLRCLVQLRVSEDEADFYTITGLKRPPRLIRLRLLDAQLRSRFGGLSDIAVRSEEIAGMGLGLRRLYLIENLQTGLALMDQPEAAAIIGLGNGVDILGQIPWLSSVEFRYWGDLDTYGLAILSQVRLYAPHAEARLMDEETLLRHADLWTEEAVQHPAASHLRLTAAEQDVYAGLKAQRWGVNLRLEQERLPWAAAWEELVR